MSEKPGDGVTAAFPCEYSTFEYRGDPAYVPQTRVYHHQTGMSLRDWFAGMALQGMLSEGFVPNQVGDETRIDKWNYAKAAYKMADAMLAERAK